MRDQVLVLTAKDFTNRRAGLALDIGQLPPGEYVLKIEAAVEGHNAGHTLWFTVQ